MIDAGFVQVQVAIDDREAAERLCDTAVADRLAAAAQIVGPIRSSYRWKGRFEVAEEWLCLFLLPGDRYRELERRIRDLHPYELPEIVAVPIRHGLGEYLAWLVSETHGPDA